MQSPDVEKLRNDFISIASHELKTPLTALKLQVQLAKRMMDEKGVESLPPKKVQQMINRTFNDVMRLSRLIEDITEVSLQNKKKSIHREWFHLEEFIENLIHRNKNTYPYFSELVNVSVDAPVMVYWDQFRIEQAIINVLGNAFKYGKGTTISIDVTTGGGYAYIVISDQGPGIEGTHHQRIFEKFERAQEREISGLGIGLFISREIAQEHSGEIILRSSPGNGSEFEFKIPLTVTASF
jgi:signal transduction histidine kinase